MFKKIFHSIQNLHQGHLFRDWDFGDGNLKYYRQQWEEVKTEKVALIGLNMVENLLMLIPLEYTG